MEVLEETWLTPRRTRSDSDVMDFCPALTLIGVGLLIRTACSIGVVVVTIHRHRAEREPQPWWSFIPPVRRAVPWWIAMWVSMLVTAGVAVAVVLG